MIEVFPKKINEEKLQANMQKLVSAFLIVTKEQVMEDKVPLTMPLTLNSKTREKELEKIK